MSHRSDRDVEQLLRRGILAVGFVGALGTMLELALARHWKSPVQLLPWVFLGVVAWTLAAVWLRPTRPVVRSARAIAVVAAGVGMFGVFEHVKANYDAAPLDAVFGPKWDATSGVSRWWHATIESVGPSPSFAPAALVLIAAVLLVATARLPRTTTPTA